MHEPEVRAGGGTVRARERGAVEQSGPVDGVPRSHGAHLRSGGEYGVFDVRGVLHRRVDDGVLDGERVLPAELRGDGVGWRLCGVVVLGEVPELSDGGERAGDALPLRGGLR